MVCLGCRNGPLIRSQRDQTDVRRATTFCSGDEFVMSYGVAGVLSYATIGRRVNKPLDLCMTDARIDLPQCRGIPNAIWQSLEIVGSRQTLVRQRPFPPVVAN